VCRKERGVEEGSARDRVDPFYSGVVGEAAEGGGGGEREPHSGGEEWDPMELLAATGGPEPTGVGGARPAYGTGMPSPKKGEVGVTDKWAQGHSNGRRRRIRFEMKI
jgi:hypothetical protein